MGAMSGLLGTAGGANGSGFSTPANANLQQPVTQNQVNAGQGGAQTALGGSAGLLQALQAQQGATNQSNAFNQGNTLYNALANNGGLQTQASAIGQQSALNKGLTGLNGVGTQGTAIGQQGSLNNQLGGAGGVGAQTGAIQGLQGVAAQQAQTAGQLQGIANGTGPNPAQAALNQATGQNVANQAALMAGQRGAGSNVGLIARQAAQQGAATQQQAAGQGATMQAQQELNALGQLTGQQQAQAGTQQAIAGVGAGLTGQQQQGITNLYGQGAGAVNQQQTGIGQQFNQGATTVGQQQGQLAANAGIANNQIGNLIGATGQNIQGNISNAGQLIGGLGNYNTNQVNSQSNVNNVTGSLANTNMQGQQALGGGLLNGLGGALSSASGARGGVVKKRKMADGGDVPYEAPNGQGPVLSEPAAPEALPGPVTQPPGATSSFGQFLNGAMNTGNFAASNDASNIQAPQIAQTPDTSANSQVPSAPQMGYGSQMLYKGASSFGSSAGSAGKMAAAAGARGGMTYDFRSGGKVQARTEKEKPVAKGNNYANDKVPAMLSAGEVVIPRSVMQSKDPVRSSADFVAKVLAKRKAQ